MGCGSPDHVSSLQSVFCDRCPGVSQCRECYQKQSPNSDYCRFLDFRRLVTSYCIVSQVRLLILG